MKRKGDFVLREIAGDNILIPVGETALRLNGMITLDEVGKVIWSALEQENSRDAILRQILDRFDVTEDTAGKDLDEFLSQMEQAGLLEP